VIGREERLTQAQALFRTANERLLERAEDYVEDGASIPFLCECADEACLGRIELTMAQYRGVRAERNRYLILPGHPRIEREHVVEDNGHFQIVEKEE
jgi:hypothetical protein